MGTNPDYEGIVVLGMPRSGTTLFRRILDAHAEVTSPPETNVMNAAARFLEEVPTTQGLTVGALSGLSFSGYAEDEVVGRLREMVFSFLREIRGKAGKRLWAEKTAFDSFHVDGITRVCADRVRYVCIFRHGLDAVCSIRELCDKLEVYLPELHEYVRRYPAPLQAFAHAWRDVNGRLHRLTQESPELAIGIRYEDLVGDPEATLDRVFDFLGLETDVPKLLDQALDGDSGVGFGDWKTYQRRTISAKSVGRWKTLDSFTVNELAAIVDPLLETLGYERTGTDTERDDEEARRRLELGLMVARLKAETEEEQDDQG